VVEDLHALGEAATAGHHQPRIANAGGCKLAFEVAWAVEVAVLAPHGCEAGDRSRPCARVGCVEQDRRIQWPSVQVVLRVDAREEAAAD
jgi:hypothetical protein